MPILKVDFRRHSDFLHSFANKGGSVLNAKKSIWSLVPYFGLLGKGRTGFCTHCLEVLWKSVIAFSKSESDFFQKIMSPKSVLKCL